MDALCKVTHYEIGSLNVVYLCPMLHYSLAFQILKLLALSYIAVLPLDYIKCLPVGEYYQK